MGLNGTDTNFLMDKKNYQEKHKIKIGKLKQKQLKRREYCWPFSGTNDLTSWLISGIK